MYYYILDLGNKYIVKIKEKMEMLMASYGISGDFGKVSPLSSAYELAQRAKEAGYSTIVAIGKSEIINQAASALVNCETTFGIIPVGAGLDICDLIGTASFKKALDNLRIRKIETIDIGKVSDNKYFLTEAKIKNPEPLKTVLDFGDFKIGGNFKEVVIKNGKKSRDSFKDGVFDIKIDHRETKNTFWGLLKKTPPVFSVFQKEQLRIETEEQANILIDDEVVAKTPCEITLIPLALKLIMARFR